MDRDLGRLLLLLILVRLFTSSATPTTWRKPRHHARPLRSTVFIAAAQSGTSTRGRPAAAGRAGGRRAGALSAPGPAHAQSPSADLAQLRRVMNHGGEDVNNESGMHRSGRRRPRGRKRGRRGGRPGHLRPKSTSSAGRNGGDFSLMSLNIHSVLPKLID